MTKEMWIWLLLGIGLVWIISNMLKYPAVTDRKPPLPINLKTNGVANGNTNDVLNRVNFQQQPYG